MSISEKIIKRLQEKGVSFKSNDNIADYVTSDELVQLQDEVTDKVRDVLRALVIDIDHDPNMEETAERIAKMYLEETFVGRYTPMPKVTEFPNAKALNDMLIVGNIPIRSTCSHHFAPILGEAWIGVVPGDKVIGISKFSRLISWIMNRPQIQEESTVQIADLLETLIAPKGVAVYVKASHACMTWRGVKDMHSCMTTQVMRGVFEDPQKRQEFLQAVKA